MKRLAVVLFAVAAGCGSPPEMIVSATATVPTTSTTTPATSTTEAAATVNESAVRLHNEIPITVASTVPTGLNGMPFAPGHLEDCERMEWYRVQVGLPADFDWIGQAESTCDNAASTWCCHGYWQIHELHIGDASRDRCSVDEIDDFDGRNALDRQRNACMALLVHDRQGVCAWDVVRGC